MHPLKNKPLDKSFIGPSESRPGICSHERHEVLYASCLSENLGNMVGYVSRTRCCLQHVGSGLLDADGVQERDIYGRAVLRCTNPMVEEEGRR